MFLLICKLYICIQNVFGYIFYMSRLHLYWKFWQFEVQKLAYMLISAAGGMIPYLSSVPPPPSSSAPCLPRHPQPQCPHVSNVNHVNSVRHTMPTVSTESAVYRAVLPPSFIVFYKIWAFPLYTALSVPKPTLPAYSPWNYWVDNIKVKIKATKHR